MDKEIFDELNRIADGFWKDKKILNQVKINGNDDFYGFTIRFDNALNDFLKVRRIDVENHDSSLDKLIGVDPVKDFYESYNKFLNVVSFAKTNDLIMDKEITKELEDHKERLSKLEKTITENESTINQQKNIIRTYTTQIENALKAFPDIKQYFGVSESEVEKG